MFARCANEAVALTKCVEHEGPLWYVRCSEPFIAMQVSVPARAEEDAHRVRACADAVLPTCTCVVAEVLHAPAVQPDAQPVGAVEQLLAGDAAKRGRARGDVAVVARGPAERAALVMVVVLGGAAKVARAHARRLHGGAPGRSTACRSCVEIERKGQTGLKQRTQRRRAHRHEQPSNGGRWRRSSGGAGRAQVHEVRPCEGMAWPGHRPGRQAD